MSETVEEDSISQTTNSSDKAVLKDQEPTEHIVTLCEPVQLNDNDSTGDTLKVEPVIPDSSKEPLHESHNSTNESNVLKDQEPTEHIVTLCEPVQLNDNDLTGDTLKVEPVIPGSSKEPLHESHNSTNESNVTTQPKRKLPDLPIDLEPLKIKCMSMSKEVLNLLNSKIKEDMDKTKASNDFARTQALRELLWKVTDLLALGTNAVQNIEGKSEYQMKLERDRQRYRNKKSRKWNQPRYEDEQQSSQISQRGRRGRRGRNSDQNWRKEQRFNYRAAKKFAKKFVDDVIKKACSVLEEEQKAEAKKSVERDIKVAVALVDTIISGSIQSILMESATLQSNLSVTEAELLCDMCEESMCEESVLMDIGEGMSIKTEPGFGG